MNAMARNHNEDMVRWLKEIGEGSEEAFDRLYGQVVPWLLPMARHLLGDRMEAEDACHDVLLEVIRHPERYDPERGTVEAWLAVQLRSRCLDRLRKRSKIVLKEEAEPIAGFGREPLSRPEETVLARMQGEAVRLALGQLPGLQRRTLAEAYFSSRSQRELAEDWQVPLGTVKSRVRYGLNHLRKALEKMGWAEPEGGDRHG
ncbi:RNA polymerase sigma factor SigK [Cohnella xylanilytica]|uniref:RNA polymerase sigma factor n=1 Tax=Cohnella xylanilytica TaxID=557555 RepID=A0A841U8G4_9BACL|nr:RNA polymerase sigma factor [Cohnella xylanilytica]MBB6696002.1 RNA polymerase sigma factor [Cohnella xylanilytica]GIO11768.1 RNA polymerase sigma factor SigK [Cohnella xylanilytica]